MTAGCHEIALVEYDGVQKSAILGLGDLICVANRIALRRETGACPLRVTHWASKPGRARPHRVFDTHPYHTSRLGAVVCLSSLNDVPSSVTAKPWAEWLVEHRRNGVLLASVCNGAFLLAEAGLLDGRQATTHWDYADSLRCRFPLIDVQEDRLIVDHGDLVTAGGAMAWTDLGLALVERFLGPVVMVETARRMLLDPRGREQRHYSGFAPRLAHGDAAILKVQHWMADNLAEEWSLGNLAALSQLEERTLLRRFQKATGLTCTDYMQRLRVNRARELLQFTSQSVDRIAWAVGYSDASAFRKVFSRHFGLTPGAYRTRFQA